MYHVPCCILEKCGKLPDSGLEKLLNAVSKTEWAIRAIWTMETQPQSYQKETISAPGLETILVIMWQRYGLCPKSLLAAKLKSNGLTSLVKEILKQPNIGSVMWLLAISLMRIYNEREQVGQKEIKNVQFEDKKSTQKFNVETQVCAERD